MKKVLLSAVLCGTLSALLMSGCSTPEEKLQSLVQELKELQKEKDDCGSDNNCRDNIRKEQEKLKKEVDIVKKELMKKHDPQIVNEKFFQALKNNDIDEAFKYCYIGEYDKEEAVREKLQKMKDKLDLPKTELIKENNGEFKYRFFFKNGQKQEVSFRFYFTDNGKYEFEMARIIYFSMPDGF